MAKELLQHSDQYITRCLTRNPDSGKALKLRDLGAEVVRGDLTKPETLSEPFEGVWGLFAVTDFYDTVREALCSI